ncbi:hypothetical protein OIU77_008730 [Salix suchowensis]|uniref:25S rRNA (uridine-N(3))-methyltransferase BMT5-like domain-containing protein n=1 Tax=Salix suchowensis TaxID=1278906 RepID=A0ABQ9AD56_9ROSI|nr:hypothetical protein OIU77_008730 [Salix suchowensis]
MDYLQSRVKMLNINNKEVKKEVKWMKHYSSCQKILLVGEGDFSFSACLGKAFGSAVNMVATSLYSKETTMLKYSKSAKNLIELKDLGCTIIYQVDAHNLRKHPLLNHILFDRIVFNFPATALKWSESNVRQIERHQRLVKSFLRSCRDMLEKNGEVHVTHKIKEPYCRWEIEKLAEDVGLCLVEKVLFRRSEYPGYSNKRGSGSRADETFPAGNSYTFKFARTT